MDIGSKCGYPCSALSNFAPHPFEIDGVQCASMEGFLQSLKFSSVEMQEYVCTLVGIKAKNKGRGKNWYRTAGADNNFKACEKLYFIDNREEL